MIPHRNLIKDIGRIIFWFPVKWCVRLLPFSSVYWIGGMLGWVDFHVMARRHRVRRMCATVANVLDKTEEEARHIIRVNFQNHGRNVLELMKYPTLSWQNLTCFVRFKGLEQVDRALQQGTGVILLTAHFGAKQLLQVALGMKEYQLNQIYYHVDEENLSYIQKHISQKQRMNIEARLPVKFISAKSFLRPVFRCLKNNEILVLTGDGAGIKALMDDSYRPFPFLGKTMLFPTNAVSLAQRTGACLIPVFAVRDQQRHTIMFEPPLQIAEIPAEQAMQEFIAVLDRYIRRYPAEWEFWEHFEEGFLLKA